MNNPLKYTDPSGWIRNYITYDDILGHQSLMEGLAQVQAGMEWMMGSRRGFGGSFTFDWTYKTYISDADQKAADESWLKYGIALSPPYTIEFYQKPIYQPSGLQFTQPFAMGTANVVAPTGDMAAMGGGGSVSQNNISYEKPKITNRNNYLRKYHCAEISQHQDEAIEVSQWTVMYIDKTYKEINYEQGTTGKYDSKPKGPFENYIFDPIHKDVVIDVKHMLAAANSIRYMGNLNEWYQGNFGNKNSAYNPQDYYSNNLGYGFHMYIMSKFLYDIEKVNTFFQNSKDIALELSIYLTNQNLRDEFEP